MIRGDADGRCDSCLGAYQSCAALQRNGKRCCPDCTHKTSAPKPNPWKERALATESRLREACQLWRDMPFDGSDKHGEMSARLDAIADLVLGPEGT
jgi:hypothetical protein